MIPFLNPLGSLWAFVSRDLSVRNFSARSRLAGCCLLAWLGIMTAVRPLEAALEYASPPADRPVYSVPFNQINVVNPQYTVNNIPDVGSVTVSFGTLFAGQSYGSSGNSLADTSPSNPLTLDYSQGSAVTMFDLAHPQSLVLGSKIGNKLYTAPLAIHFSQDVSHVLFDLGHLDQNSPTRIEGYDRSGNSLGVLGGLSSGFVSTSVGDTTGGNRIAGLSIYVPDGEMDWEGFGLSNVRFSLGSGSEPQVPEPSALVVWAVLGLVGGSGASWYKKRAALAKAC
jgi:hypothetical protein